MHKRRIAFIVEGEKREQAIIYNIHKIFFQNQTMLDVFTLSAKQNIYMLAQKMKAEPDVDTIEVLRESDKEAAERLEGLTRDSFQEIYLFFDYDGHTNNISDEQERIKAIEDMLRTFDNETEQGKLYISYPMVEALRDIISHKDICYNRCSVVLQAGKMKNYKNDSAWNEAYVHINRYNLETWKRILDYYRHRVGCLLSLQEDKIRHTDFGRSITTGNIYKAQFQQYIEPHNRVFIISAFPQFLLEYFKEEF